MRVCGRHSLLWSLLVCAGFLCAASPAGAQLPGPDAVVDDVVETASGVVAQVDVADVGDKGTIASDLGGKGAIASDVAEGTIASADGTLDGALGTSTSSGDSTASASSTSSPREARAKSASQGGGSRTRFDPLPARLERLLERIERGRNVTANLRRLERAFASVSARQQERILRFLNAEIRRLRADGVTRAEQKLVQRLTRARDTLTSSRPAGTGTVSTGGAALPSPLPGAAGESPDPVAGAVLGASAVGTQVEASAVRTKAPAEGERIEGNGTPDRWDFPVVFVLLGLGVLGAVAAGVAFGLREQQAG